jgi:DNA mismatch endonuclease (patch repair protein)
VVPKTRTDWWLNKINRTKELDRINKKKLKDLGWNVITIFECELKKENLEKTLSKLVKQLNEDRNSGH